MKRQILFAAIGTAVVFGGLTLTASGVRHGLRQRASPRDTVKAEVDGATFTIEYGRPYKRGRTIWGALVPWDKWWMPGADESTTLTASRPIVIGTLEVPAEPHTIYTLPGEEKFLLIVNNELGTFHTRYFPNRDLGRVPMTKTPVDPMVEQMTFAIAPREGGGGVLKLIWDDRAYSVDFVVK
jgi:hypothetical protein